MTVSVISCLFISERNCCCLIGRINYCHSSFSRNRYIQSICCNAFKLIAQSLQFTDRITPWRNICKVTGHYRVISRNRIHSWFKFYIIFIDMRNSLLILSCYSESKYWISMCPGNIFFLNFFVIVILPSVVTGFILTQDLFVICVSCILSETIVLDAVLTIA